MRVFGFVRHSVIAITLVSVSLMATAARAGSIGYDVVIDTSSFSGAVGDLDFQLATDQKNVGITAAFTSFSSNATLNGSTQTYADSPPNVTVTGDLGANTLSLFNDGTVNAYADADQPFTTFGTYFSFHVTLSGAGIGASSASSASLAIAVFDSVGNPFFSGPNNRNNAAVYFQTHTDGSVTRTDYPLLSSTVPEPSSFVSMLLGSLGIAIYRRRLRAN